MSGRGLSAASPAAAQHGGFWIQTLPWPLGYPFYQRRGAGLWALTLAWLHSGSDMPGYDYTLLSVAADSGHGTFNIYAVVAECSVPRPTRGTGAAHK